MWKNRAGSETELFVRVSPDDRQLLATVFPTEWRLSFLSAVPGADR